MRDEHTHDWLNEREATDDRPSRSDLADDDETTLKINVRYVGDLRQALKDIPGAWRLELRAGFPSGPEPVIEEITMTSDGRIVIYIA